MRFLVCEIECYAVIDFLWAVDHVIDLYWYLLLIDIIFDVVLQFDTHFILTLLTITKFAINNNFLPFNIPLFAIILIILYSNICNNLMHTLFLPLLLTDMIKWITFRFDIGFSFEYCYEIIVAVRGKYISIMKFQWKIVYMGMSMSVYIYG